MKSMIFTIMFIFALWMVGSSFTGCASSRSGQVYSRDQARQVHTVETGTVTSVKQVMIEGTKTPVGTVAGGVAGGVAGSTVGGGSGRALATVAGALIGAAAGSVMEEELTKKQGLEIVIDKDDGQTIVIVQEADMPLQTGDRVRIITSPDGTTRVSK